MEETFSLVDVIGKLEYPRLLLRQLNEDGCLGKPFHCGYCNSLGGPEMEKDTVDTCVSMQILLVPEV